MTMHQRDLTIDEALADPMIRTVMRADRVEPRQLEALLRTLASVQGSGEVGSIAPAFASYGAPTRMARAIDCGSACSW